MDRIFPIALVLYSLGVKIKQKGKLHKVLFLWCSLLFPNPQLIPVLSPLGSSPYPTMPAMQASVARFPVQTNGLEDLFLHSYHLRILIRTQRKTLRSCKSSSRVLTISLKPK